MLLAAIPTVGLDGVANFRLVSPSLPGIYRSAALERATAADAAEILDRYKIRTIIDLRNEDEIDKARASATQFGRSLCAAYDGCEPVGPGCLASEGSGWLCRERVPLLADVDAFWAAVEAKLGPVAKAKGTALRAFNGAAYDQLLADELVRGGQAMLYTCMLQSADASAWRRALALAADRSRGAVLIHCAKGKDRTGVLAALLQHAANDGEAAIVDAYAASAALEPASEAADAGDSRVDWSKLRGAPPEAMAETLGYLRSEYGAIDGFLESVECGEAWRAELLQGARTPILRSPT